ncbi:trigger factor [Croceimicrobium sp.]|uniref:trigger factor n=1 Tax=Croceimicrobium sp. TaxID=2828340 RepID=UPI003BAD764D
MKVNVQKIDDLNAVLTVAIEESDYREKVDKTLKDYRKKANIPGFRPGHVPAGLIRKQFGKSVLIEEINHILQHAVYDHIQEEKLDILGNPMPVEQDNIDWEGQKDFQFDYELGLAPEFELKLNARTKIPFNKVIADDEMIDRYVTDYARRFGTMSYPETVEENAILKAKFVEVDKKDQAVEGGIEAESTIALEALTDKAAKTVLGKKVGDKVVLAKKDFKDDFRLAGVLKVEDEVLENSSYRFELEITELSKLDPAELNQELFDKVFGEGAVSNEEEFRARIKADAERVFVGDSDRKFYQDVRDKLLDKYKFELPDLFLKKWMKTATEEPMSEEEIEEKFPQMKDDMRWQIIENRVIRENDIKVEHEEMVEYTKQMVLQQMAQYGQFPEGMDLDKIAHNVLGNREEAQRINDQLFQQKLMQFFKDTFKLDEQEVTYGEFVKSFYGN